MTMPCPILWLGNLQPSSAPNIQRPIEPLVLLHKPPCSQASTTCTSLSNWAGFHGEPEDLMVTLFTVTGKLYIKDNPFVRLFYSAYLRHAAQQEKICTAPHTHTRAKMIAVGKINTPITPVTAFSPPLAKQL